MGSGITLKTYKSLLYLTQFIASPDSLEGLSKSLPRLLSNLRIQDESLRISIIETLRDFNNDVQYLHKTLSESKKLQTRTSRLFIKNFFIVFGLLAASASCQKIFTVRRAPLKIGLSSSELISPVRYAASVSMMATALPLIQSKIANEDVAALAHSSLALSLMPEGYSKDYTAIYALVQAVEYSLKSLKYIDDICWLLVPLSYSEILHLATTTPQYLPITVIKALEALYSGFIEKTPEWYAKESFQTIHILMNIHKARRVDKGLLHSNVTLTRVNPGHKNARFSILSPSEPSLTRVLQKNIMKKSFNLIGMSFPFFLLVNYLRSRWSSDPEENPGWKRLAKASIKPTLKFTVTTLLTVITSYCLLITKLSPRLNGLISGLWFYLYKDTGSTHLFIYLARITFLSTFRKNRDRLSCGGDIGSIVSSTLSTIVGSLSILQLLKLEKEGKLNGRFQNYIQLIKKGGFEEST
jgi:hypothetical protein